MTLTPLRSLRMPSLFCIPIWIEKRSITPSEMKARAGAMSCRLQASWIFRKAAAARARNCGSSNAASRSRMRAVASPMRALSCVCRLRRMVRLMPRSPVSRVPRLDLLLRIHSRITTSRIGTLSCG